MNRFFRLLPPALALFAGLAAAEEQYTSDRVARLSYIQGNVSLEADGSRDSQAAVLNRPLTSGDALWVNRESRAELQADKVSIHLDQATGLALLNLDDRNLQMSLAEGSLNVRVRSLARDESIEIETPNATVSLLRSGEYRVSVENGGNVTVVAVRSGESEISHDRQTFSLNSRQQGRFTGTGYLTADVYSVGARDDFEAWADDRNRRDQRSVSSQYVSPDVIGYEDLDEYGSWSSEPDYGYVWYPRTVATGWAPYRFGSWAWVAPWGWTWVDRAPWGFAPFHYGRWAQVRSRWCWVPGPRHVRQTFLPRTWVNEREVQTPPIIARPDRRERVWSTGRGDLGIVRPPKRILDRDVTMRRETPPAIRQPTLTPNVQRPVMREERRERVERQQRVERPIMAPARVHERRAEQPMPQRDVARQEAPRDQPARKPDQPQHQPQNKFRKRAELDR